MRNTTGINPITLMGSVLGLAISFLPTAATAQFTPDVQQQCDRAIASTNPRLIANRRITVSDDYFWRIAEQYSGYPEDKPMAYTIVISDRDAQNVMSSPQLLTSVAQTIIQGCPPVGLVTFVLAESDWYRPFGQVGSRIREFECIDPGEGITDPWGYTTCI